MSLAAPRFDLPAAVGLLLACAAWAAWAQPRLPTAPVHNVPETFYGTRVDDPYRDLENPAAPAVANWMKAHSEQARALLRSISGREALRSKLERFEGAAAARVVGVTRLPGDIYLYQRRSAAEEGFKLVMRQGLQGREAVVFDPNLPKKKSGQPLAIRSATPSADGRLVAVAVSAGGAEEAVLRVLETRSGRALGRDIDRVSPGSVSWLPDGSGLFFHRLQAPAKGAAATEKNLRGQAVFMKPGAGETGIRTVVTAGLDLGLAPSERAFVEVQPDGRALLVVSEAGVSEAGVSEAGVSETAANNSVSTALKLWHSTAAAVLAGKADWKPLAGPEDRVTAVALKGEHFYALTCAGAPRFKVVGGKLDSDTVATAPVLVPEGERVLTGLAVASDALYVAAREGNLYQLLRRAHREDAAVAEVPLPVLGAFSLDAGSAGHARADLPGLLLRLTSWTRASQVFAVAPDGRVTNTGLQPSGPDDAPGDVLASEVLVPRPDGAQVPLSIIHKADVVLDGNNPTLLVGYGSHGRTEAPAFSTSRMAWLEAGGVFAVANPRGSGAWGRDWHEAGRGAGKPNSWRDFIACAEWLVANRWTQPSRLATWGAGAGGLLVGMAMNERPDLFAAVVLEAGALDMVRAETTAKGATRIPEFGSRATEAGFAALLAMSTYHQVRAGVQYPAVLFIHGVNDPRAEVWHTTKTAARLMAATGNGGNGGNSSNGSNGSNGSNSGRPVLMRLSSDAGPGAGGFSSPAPDETADLFAFLLWQLAVPGYAPVPARR